MKSKYALEYTEDQWTEITSLAFTGFKITVREPLYRDQWMAIGHMALGKAQRVRAGAYEYEDKEWADELVGIADVIFNKFRPGDGQI